MLIYIIIKRVYGAGRQPAGVTRPEMCRVTRPVRAGMGKRLKQLTQNNTKCMVKVNGVPLINRTLNQLEQHNLSRIVIVTGYEGQKLREHIEGLHIKTPVVFIDNPVYDRTNNIYSLFLAKDYLLKEDTLLLESDIIFEDSVLNSLTDDPRDLSLIHI